MIVLKIGGSLYGSPCLKEWLNVVPDAGESIVIVPGGGPFADQVRAADEKWCLPTNCAHDMAVLGMQQFGHMMTGINPYLQLESCYQVMLKDTEPSKAIVWAPYEDVLAAKEIEKSWQTTSDSLALWLATKISAKHLCVVKSAVTTGKSIQQLIAQKIVDRNFENFQANYGGQILFYHATQAQQFIEDINNGIFA